MEVNSSFKQPLSFVLVSDVDFQPDPSSIRCPSALSLHRGAVPYRKYWTTSPEDCCVPHSRLSLSVLANDLLCHRPPRKCDGWPIEYLTELVETLSVPSLCTFLGGEEREEKATNYYFSTNSYLSLAVSQTFRI